MRKNATSIMDYMAFICVLGLCLAYVRWLTPGRVGSTHVVVAPLIGSLFHRQMGGRGILGGALGGVCYAVALFAASYWLPYQLGLPSLVNMPRRGVQIFAVTSFSVAFGTAVGLVFWIVSARMRRVSKSF